MVFFDKEVLKNNIWVKLKNIKVKDTLKFNKYYTVYKDAKLVIDEDNIDEDLNYVVVTKYKYHELENLMKIMRKPNSPQIMNNFLNFEMVV